MWHSTVVGSSYHLIGIHTLLIDRFEVASDVGILGGYPLCLHLPMHIDLHVALPFDIPQMMVALEV